MGEQTSYKQKHFHAEIKQLCTVTKCRHTGVGFFVSIMILHMPSLFLEYLEFVLYPIFLLNFTWYARERVL